MADVDLKALVRTIPDYPKAGIMFRDITTLIGDANGFRDTVSRLVEPFKSANIGAVVGIEARGFILGGTVAEKLSTGFVPIRKKGKLPWKAIGQDYALEYGMDAIEMHEDAIHPGQRVLIIDDLIATGGTAQAAVKLLRRAGGHIAGAAFVIDLPDLGGLKKLKADGVRCHALVEFSGH